ncbi:MAG TPA: NYN domain-containing protein [Candidatus Hydrogenedentes bacterium]|nr:NYN domain-containing protein [Candidatus Hydrogenedentota bacterium]HPG68540.1 NYN domain-containing protein [Candidatus Hydrogenedentota bacterium]
MSWTYYIDGYNVIHHSDALRHLADESFEAARDALIERTGHFCSTSGGTTAVIVFDGQGRLEERKAGPLPRGVRATYSAAGQTADSVIERQVFLAADRASVMVVTADRAIRAVCAGMGAKVMSPYNFLGSVLEARASIARRLRQGRETGGARRIEERLGAEVVRRLGELRDKLHRRPTPKKRVLPANAGHEAQGPASTSPTVSEGLEALPWVEQLRFLRNQLRRAEREAQRPPVRLRPSAQRPERLYRSFSSERVEARLDVSSQAALREIRNALKPPEPVPPPARPSTRKLRSPRVTRRVVEPSPPTYTSGSQGRGLDENAQERLAEMRRRLEPEKPPATSPPKSAPKGQSKASTRKPAPPSEPTHTSGAAQRGLGEEALERLREWRDKLGEKK